LRPDDRETGQRLRGIVSEAVIGLDVGTTVAKAVLFDPSGAELHVAEQAYRLHTPQPGWVELEPDDIWQAVAGVLRAITDWAAPGMRIRAVALATQGGTLIPCRADGTPTYRAITWMDGRSQDLAARWRAEGVGNRVRRISGWSPEPGLPLLSIGWLRQARPEVFAATERFLSVNDFLAQRLTGRFATNPSMAGEMLLTDITTGQWSEELCRLVDIGPEFLSPILPAAAPLGQVQPEAGHLTGLAPGTVVINGGQDHSCEALALGMTSAGAGLLACGTALVINAIAESPSVDAIPARMDLNYHVVPGRWVVSQFLGGLGACLEWWLNQCGQHATQTRDEAWATFNAALAGTAPGCGGLVYLPQTGVRQTPGSLRHGGFVGLRLDHSWADLGRAMLEGAAYELRWALEHLRGAGLAIELMWMIGGATQSPLWPQIVADVSGVPVLLSQYTHGPALGAAILAGVGLGTFDSVEAAQARFRVSAWRLEPDDAHAPVYDRQFAAYQRLARVLTP
jgi:xylulokinase